MNLNCQKIKRVLSRNVEKIIDSKHLEEKMLSGKSLRIKLGIDPTGPNIHLGRASALWKLKEFQDLGHKIVLILGDYTAQIGDPSDKLNKRPFISREQVNKNLHNYQTQINLILDAKKIEWHSNSEWLSKLKLRQMDELADLFSVQQMIARRNFHQRWKNKKDISIRELHYPLYQGYDSVMVRADLEIGGMDQLFNLLAGRKVQEFYKQFPQDVMALKMLEGTDNRKMSTSQGNVINITDSPEEQYGKIMSMQDNLIIKYFELCTPLSMEEISKITKEMEKGANPRDFKAKLAYEIVKLYHGENSAKKAGEEFEKIFKNKENPSKIPIYKIKKGKHKLIDVIYNAKLVSSKTKARNLIDQGGVKINNEVIKDWRYEFIPQNGMVIKAGKRKFIKLFY